MWSMSAFVLLFFFKYTATTKIYTSGHTLSLHDALPFCTHLHGPARGRRHDRVAVPIKADEAGSGDGVLALMEAVERCQDRLQGRSFHLQRLGDGDEIGRAHV